MAEPIRLFPPDPRTIGGRYLFPFIDYVVRVAEIVALAALFRAAADLSGHWLLEVFSILLAICGGGYAGIIFTAIFLGIKRIEEKNRRLAWALGIPAAILVGLGAVVIGHEISQVVSELTEVSP
ncbi:hypothetical protein [Alteriqipengyuania sp. 357]